MATVLVIEDEPTVLVLAEAIIADLGHHTLTAANGGEAMAIVEGDMPVDVLFTDINLGEGPSGLDVAAAAHARWQQVHVIYVSGQILTDGMRALMVEGSTFLAKPYTPDQIEDAIRAALAAR